MATHDEDSPTRKFDPGKRDFLHAALWWTAGVATSLATDILGNLVTPSVSRLLGPPELSPGNAGVPARGAARAALIHQLLLYSGAERTQFIPPRDWTLGLPDVDLGSGVSTYGHEAQVLRSIARFLCSEHLAIWQPTRAKPRPDPHSSQVLLGSGSSNSATRRLIGAPWSPMVNLGSLQLHYTIGDGKGTLKRYQYGRELERPAHAICTHDLRPVLSPEARGGWQQDDYLLVTKIPGNVKNTVRTIFAGLHGPGTRATELLFDSVPLGDLEELAAAVGSHVGRACYFQAVFRASAFITVDGSQIATRLALADCPPLPIVVDLS